MLLFHGGISWASGGYLGVSLFFTLSGFLITRLLLEERDRSGRVDLGRFYARRIRRLLPASCLCLFGILVLSQFGAFDDAANLRRDLLGALSQLANWAQLTSGRSYADLFTAGASPVEHYWSLAIEEQFYLVWPLLFGLLLAGRSRRWVGRMALGLFLLCAVLPRLIANVWGTNAAYLSTPARLAELFAGVLLAVVTQQRAVPAWFRWVAVAELALFAALVATTPSGAGWAYEGGLPLFAVLSAAFIAGLQVPGPVQTVLVQRPLVYVGTISYGIYLFHWPVFLLAEQHWASLGFGWLFGVKVAITAAVAVTSAALVERPIRTGQTWVSPRVTVSAGLVTTALLAAAVVVVAPGPPPGFGSINQSRAEAVAVQPVKPDESVPDRAGGKPRPIRVLVVGDSTAEVLGAGLIEWAFANPGVAQVTVDAIGGCGLVAGGRLNDFLDFAREECDKKMHEGIAASYPTLQPDIVLISITAADTWDRTWPGGKELRPTAPDYARRIREGYSDFFQDAIAADVPHVVWLRPAAIGTEPRYADPSYADGSQALIQNVVESAAKQNPDVIEVLDFRAWFETTPYPSDQKVRPDGVHLIAPVAATVASDWLGPQLLDIAGS